MKFPIALSRKDRSHERRLRDARARLDEAKQVLQLLNDSGIPSADWRAELAERWKEWDDEENERIQKDLMDSLRATRPGATDPEIERLAVWLGRNDK